MGPKRRKSAVGGAGRKARDESASPVGVRIIGGEFRGRKLEYSGDIRTRPMKDRVREALFSRLWPTVPEKIAVDLFAGTGALGLEAISRGAARAVFIEQHGPTARAIGQSAATLGIEDLVEIITADTFLWFRRFQKADAQRLSQTPGGPPGQAAPVLFSDPFSMPWLVFCSPPYEFFVSRVGEMLELVGGLMALAPAGSRFVVETDERFDFLSLPDAPRWDVRQYPPAVVGIWEKEGG